MKLCTSLLLSIVAVACVQPNPDIHVFIHDTPGGLDSPGEGDISIEPNPSPQPPPQVVISPAQLDFGVVKAGQFANAIFHVANTGGKPLTITQAIFQGADAFYFIHENGPQAEDENAPFIAWVPPLTLKAGESARLSVNFHPLQTVGMNGRLILRTNDSDPEMKVSGKGVSYCPPLSHAELNFGGQPAGIEVTRTVHVAGCLTGLRILAVAASADSDSVFTIDTSLIGDPNSAPWMVNPNETAGFNIRFKPDENAPAGTEWHATAMVATMNSNEVLELPIRGRVADIF